MPKHVTAPVKEIFGEMVRKTWLPVIDEDGQETITRYGGAQALMEPGSDWPIFQAVPESGYAMQLCFQADTDALPEEMRERFGGAGMIFQFFCAYGYNEEEDCPIFMDSSNDYLVNDKAWCVRVFPKTAQLITMDQPDQDTGPAVDAQFVKSWDQRFDVPFQHGGPYLSEVEPAMEEFNRAREVYWSKVTELPPVDAGPSDADKHFIHEDDLAEGVRVDGGTNEWTTKIGGWPSLEQGPQESFQESWDHLLQFDGNTWSRGCPIGGKLAFDGHAWLVKKPSGGWGFYNVYS